MDRLYKTCANVGAAAAILYMFAASVSADGISDMSKRLGPDGKRVYRLFEDEFRRGQPKSYDKFKKMKADDVARIKKDKKELGEKVCAVYSRGFIEFIDVFYGNGDKKVSEQEYVQFIQANKNSAAISASIDEGVLPDFNAVKNKYPKKQSDHKRYLNKATQTPINPDYLTHYRKR